MYLNHSYTVPSKEANVSAGSISPSLFSDYNDEDVRHDGNDPIHCHLHLLSEATPTSGSKTSMSMDVKVIRKG